MSYMQNSSRRSSLLEVSQASKWRPRSSSMSVAEVAYSPLTSDAVTRRKSATPCIAPCFMSPRMAFTTQFSYDSPIQILTSKSSGILSPRSMSNYKRRCQCSLKNLPHCCKMILILMLFTISSGLFIYRTINERQNIPVLGMNSDCRHNDSDCEELNDELVHDHPSLQRFMRSVKQPTHFHALTSDLSDLEVQSDDELQILPQFLQSEENETGNLKEGTSLDQLNEELAEFDSEPLQNHWMTDHEDHYHKIQRITIQGKYIEDLEGQQQHEAVHNLQQGTVQEGGSMSRNFQGEFIEAQPYPILGEPSSLVQQNLNAPVEQHNVQEHDGEQQNAREHIGTERQFPEVINAAQGEFVYKIPPRNYAGYGNGERHMLQDLERQRGPRMHHHQSLPTKPQQRRFLNPRDEALQHRADRKPRHGPLKANEQRPARVEGNRGYYGQRFPPGVNPNRYRLSEI